jgi:hypothetical protein
MQQPSYEQPRSEPRVTPGFLADQSAQRVLGALAHGAIALGLFGFTLVASLLVSAVIWVYARRSPEVRFHAEQAGCYQLIVLLVNALFLLGVGTTGGFWIFNLLQGKGPGELGAGVVVGLCLFAVWIAISTAYGIIAAVMVLLGKRFKYVFIGDRFEKRVF